MEREEEYYQLLTKEGKSRKGNKFISGFINKIIQTGIEKDIQGLGGGCMCTEVEIKNGGIK